MTAKIHYFHKKQVSSAELSLNLFVVLPHARVIASVVTHEEAFAVLQVVLPTAEPRIAICPDIKPHAHAFAVNHLAKIHVAITEIHGFQNEGVQFRNINVHRIFINRLVIAERSEIDDFPVAVEDDCVIAVLFAV